MSRHRDHLSEANSCDIDPPSPSGISLYIRNELPIVSQYG